MHKFAQIATASTASLIASQMSTAYAARNIDTLQFGQFVIALLVATVIAVFIDLGGRLHYTTRLTKLKRRDTRHAHFLVAMRRVSCVNLFLGLPLVLAGILICSSTNLLFIGSLMGLLSSVYSNALSFRQITTTNASPHAINAAVEFVRLILLFMLMRFTAMHGLAILSISLLASRAIGVVALIGPSAPRLLIRIPRRIGVAALYARSSSIFWSGALSLVNVRAGDALVAATLPPNRIAELNVAMQLPAAALRIFEMIKLNVVQEIGAIKGVTIAKRLILACLILQIGLFFAAPMLANVFLWVYGDKFRDAQTLFLGLASWIIFSLANYMASLSLIVKGASRRELETNKLSLLLSPALYLIFVYALGVQGVVATMWILSCVSLSLNTYWLLRLDN